LRRHNFAPFVIYRILAAAAILVIIATGLRAASGT
jgi:undecaprenyl pyrophosphate phosphatase UppP